MKIMENKLKQLEKENEDDFFRIRSEERRKEVSRMIKYISSSSLPLYQIQIIRKDLLGMAQEAERQELPLKDMLGVEPREFCDEIIENAATPARKEWAFQVVIDVLQPFAIYFTFMWTCGGMPSRFGITLTDIIAFLGLCGICRGLMRYMGNRLAIKGSPILNLLPYLFFACMVAAIAIGGRSVLGSVGGMYVISGPGLFMVILVDVIAIGATLLWNRYWNKFPK